jgi:hypothetical protein
MVTGKEGNPSAHKGLASMLKAEAAPMATEGAIARHTGGVVPVRRPQVRRAPSESQLLYIKIR